jgi:hypothetical protein
MEEHLHRSGLSGPPVGQVVHLAEVHRMHGNLLPAVARRSEESRHPLPPGLAGVVRGQGGGI